MDPHGMHEVGPEILTLSLPHVKHLLISLESWTVSAQQFYFTLISQPDNVFLFLGQEGDGEKMGNASDSAYQREAQTYPLSIEIGESKS